MIRYCCAAIDPDSNEIAHVHVSRVPLKDGFSVSETDLEGNTRVLPIQEFTFDAPAEMRIPAWVVREHLVLRQGKVGWRLGAPPDIMDLDIRDV